MSTTVPDPRYVTLDSTGAGAVQFRGVRPNMVMNIHRITVETPIQTAAVTLPAAAGTGHVGIYFRGQLLTSKALGSTMTADGLIDVRAGEEVDVRISDGPAAALVKVTAHYQEMSI